MVGGHLPSLSERGSSSDFKCPVFTTAEILLTENLDLTFKREIDPETTFDELVIYNRQNEEL